MAEKKKRRTNMNGLAKLVNFVDENKKPIAKNILRKLKFINETLDELEEKIEDEGPVIKAINGNGFETITEHPAQKSYNTMLGRYNALIKTFSDLIPPGVTKNDEFMEFLSGKK